MTSEGQSTTTGAKYAGIAAVPLKPAPPLALDDSLGDPINLNQYRGKAVFITFIYDHCPDVCPLIVGNLHTALAQLGPEAQKVQVIAVSVDPRGDTPKTVRAFLQAHRMTGRMEYLIGSRPRLERVWRDWHILSKSSSRKAGPDLVEHSALIYGISASGKITTLYPSNFTPSQIVHDVPILASE
jgi:protein SCO1/2